MRRPLSSLIINQLKDGQEKTLAELQKAIGGEKPPIWTSLQRLREAQLVVQYDYGEDENKNSLKKWHYLGGYDEGKLEAELAAWKAYQKLDKANQDRENHAVGEIMGTKDGAGVAFFEYLEQLMTASVNYPPNKDKLETSRHDAVEYLNSHQELVNEVFCYLIASHKNK